VAKGSRFVGPLYTASAIAQLQGGATKGDRVKALKTTYPCGLGEVTGVDKLIALDVRILRDSCVETIQSCQGGDGHTYPEPTIEFAGGRAEGFRALAVALAHGRPIHELRRVWSIQDGEPVGPHWALVYVDRPGEGYAARKKKR
jgi:hypothetical protein